MAQWLASLFGPQEMKVHLAWWARLQDFNGRIGPKGKTWAPFLGPNQCWMGYYYSLIITKSLILFECFWDHIGYQYQKKDVKQVIKKSANNHN